MGAYPTIRLSDDLPAAPAGAVNVDFQGVPSTHNPTQVNVTANVKIMVASGASHAPGLAPDPGASSGTSKFLREDATWATPSGGGGSMPSGSNVVFGAPRVATDSGFSTLSAIKKLAAGMILNLASSWKFSLEFDSGTGYVINAVIYRTLIDSTTVVDSTAVTYGTNPTGTLNSGELFCDPIAMVLDTAHDYYIVVYFQSGSGTIKVFTAGTLLNGNQNTGYVSGDKTGLTGGGSIPSVSPEETIYRVIST